MPRVRHECMHKKKKKTWRKDMLWVMMILESEGNVIAKIDVFEKVWVCSTFHVLLTIYVDS